MLKELTYNILVLDDDSDLYDDYVEHMESRLSEEGYQLEHDRIEELTDLNSISLDNVDLFLVDLKFGKEDRGLDFIKAIRDNHLTDILFYSSDNKTINEYRKSGEFQAVFYAVRDEYNSEVFNVLDQLLDKMILRANTPRAARGIVLGCVAELDNLIKEKIAFLVNLTSDDQLYNLRNKCAKLYYSSFKSLSNKHTDFWNVEFNKGIVPWNEVKNSICEFDINELVNNIKITDSSKNLRVLLQALSVANGKNELYSQIQEYDELLIIRNILAHVKETLSPEGDYVFCSSERNENVVLTRDMCKKLRKKLIYYYNQIQQIS